jgi:hypothetical protein
MISEHLLQRTDDPPIRTTVEVRKRQQPVREIRPHRTSDDSTAAAPALHRIVMWQKSLRSCHKRLESEVAPMGLLAGNRQFRGLRDRPHEFRWFDKTCVLSIDYEAGARVPGAVTALKPARDEQTHVNTCGFLRLPTAAIRPNDDRG